MLGKRFANQLAETPTGHDILPIVLTYCQPEDGDRLLGCLVQGGFDSVLYVDNGSPRELRSRHANLVLPKNIGLAGQIRLALTYAMDHTPARYYWLLTTSVDLPPGMAILDHMGAALEDLSPLRPAIYSPSLAGSEAAIHIDLYAETSATPAHRYWLCRPTLFQMVAMLIAHDFCETLRYQEAGLFNPGLSLGWGLDVESIYVGLLRDRPAIADRQFVARLEKNRGQKRKRYAPPRGTAGLTPIEQLNLVFRNRYGHRCWELFEQAFLDHARTLPADIGIAQAPLDYWVNGIDGQTVRPELDEMQRRAS